VAGFLNLPPPKKPQSGLRAWLHKVRTVRCAKFTLKSKQLKKLRKKISHEGVYQLAKLGLWLTRALPVNLGLKLGENLGELTFYLVARERRKTLHHLQLALGEKYTPQELHHIAKASYRHLGRCFFELGGMDKPGGMSLDDRVSLEGREHLDAALKKGKGVIFITAHLGNWELLAIYGARMGYPLNVIGRKTHNAKLGELIVELRSKYGVKTILRQRRGRVRQGIWQALRQNQLLGMLIDQDTKVEGVFVDFFGRPAYTPIGPVALALRTGAVLLAGFTIRQPDGRHKIEILPPYELALTGDKQEDIRLNTARLTHIIEEYIARYPAQWVWMHRRWRRQPPAGANHEA